MLASPRSRAWLPRLLLALSLSILTLQPCAAVPRNPQDATATATATAPVSGLEERLERLAEELESQLESQHAAGMSIAIVVGDRIVLSRGFGLRDVEAGLPATEDTVYAIGSVTKSFTAALVAMLADEGAMNWDDPVRKHLPAFTLKDKDANEKITIRDLLSHRSGLRSLDLLWYAGTATWEDMLPCIERAEPTAKLGEKFQYNNVMYLAAGQAAAAAGKSDWATLVTDRILTPLGMTGSGATLPLLASDEHLARGYRWKEPEDEDDGFGGFGEEEEVEEEPVGKLELLPMRSTVNIAPAGSIHSSAREMTQWVRLQLNRGEVDGRRLIAAERFDEMWSDEITMSPGVKYGLGWMIGEHKGHRVLEHGGGIDGFTCNVTFLPDDGMGFVVLTNADSSALPTIARALTISALLDDGGGDAAPALDFTAMKPRFGKYHCAPLRSDMTVLIQNGRLAVDVPGQMIYELNPPDEDGRWTFRGFEHIAVTFPSPDEDGVVRSMTLFQGGLEILMPRVGIEIEPVITMNEARPYLGRYREDGKDETFEVVVQNGRLAVDVPGQMICELDEPDEKGHWKVRVNRKVSVAFERNEEGVITTMSMGDEAERVQLVRVDAPGAVVEGDSLPSPEGMMALVHAARGTEAYLEIFNLRFTGTVDFVNIGIRGTIEQLLSGFDRFWQRAEFEPFGWSQSAFIGWEGWEDSAYQPLLTLRGEFLDQAKLGHPALLLSHWWDAFDEIETIEKVTEGGSEVILMRFKPKDLPSVTMWIDTKNGQVLRAKGAIKVASGATIPVSARFEDYRVIGGVTIPFRVITEDDAKGRVVVQFERVEKNVELADEPWFMNPS